MPTSPMSRRPRREALIELACSRTNREALGDGSAADVVRNANEVKTLNRRRSARPFTTNRVRHTSVPM